ENIPEPGAPEAFKVLIKELQSLCLDVRVLTEDSQVIEIREEEEDISEMARELGIDIQGREDDREEGGKTAAQAGSEGEADGESADEEEPEEADEAEEEPDALFLAEDDELDDTQPLVTPEELAELYGQADGLEDEEDDAESRRRAEARGRAYAPRAAVDGRGPSEGEGVAEVDAQADGLEDEAGDAASRRRA